MLNVFPKILESSEHRRLLLISMVAYLNIYMLVCRDIKMDKCVCKLIREYVLSGRQKFGDQQLTVVLLHNQSEDAGETSALLQ